jgi:hypothetical protein
MRVARITLIAAVVTAAAMTTASVASAAQPETARPNAAQALARVEMPVVGHTPAGVPAAKRTPGGGANGISYHNGPILNSSLGVNVYLIWYGNWSTTATATTGILPTLIKGLSGSAYFNINTTYYDSNNTPATSLVTLKGATTDNYSLGATTLSDSAITAVVAKAIASGSGSLPTDTNALYFVLTSADVTKSGFLTSYCGWHTNGTINGADIKYSFVGNPGTNSACSVQTVASPNGNVGEDAMASVMAHELEETVTDPQLNAWYDSRGYENADKCAWTFGTTTTLANGSKFNMLLGGRNYLIQRNWLNANGGTCTLSYP